MRLFAAVYPPAAALDELSAYVSGRVPPDLRRVPREQWHVTTAFYGEVAAAAVPELTDRLSRVGARTPPLRLSLAGAGAFPRPRAARQLWVGVRGDIQTLALLAGRCVAAARRAGAAVDERRYRPHLTLGRPRRGPADLTAAVEALSGFTGLEFEVDALVLVRSTLGARVVHEPMAEFELRGRGASPATDR